MSPHLKRLEKEWKRISPYSLKWVHFWPIYFQEQNYFVFEHLLQLKRFEEIFDRKNWRQCFPHLSEAFPILLFLFYAKPAKDPEFSEVDYRSVQICVNFWLNLVIEYLWKGLNRADSWSLDFLQMADPFPISNPETIANRGIAIIALG